MVKDATTLKDWTERFDNVIDSGLFHVFSDDDRRRYIEGLATVLKPDGRLYLMCFSDEEPGTQGPRRISRREFEDAFAKGWSIESLEPSRFEVRPDLKDFSFSEGGPKAWFGVVKDATVKFEGVKLGFSALPVSSSSPKREAKMPDRKAAFAKARKEAKWAVTMTKVRIRRIIARTRWQLVTFLGPSGGEARGIVDMMAIRKNHSDNAGLKRGDLFELVLIQVKGGSAPLPTADDRERLRMVSIVYRAKAVILAKWKRGREVVFYQLKGDSWELVSSPAELFH